MTSAVETSSQAVAPSLIIVSYSMSRMFPMRNAAVKLLVLAAALGPRTAVAKDEDAPAGKIVFAARGQIQEIDPAGGSPSPRAPLPAGTQALRMEATRDGNLVLVDAGARSIWFWKGEQSPVECAGRARPSPRGDCVACLEAAGVRLLQTAGKVLRTLPAELRDVNFYGPTASELVALAPDGVVAFFAGKPEQRRVLAAPGARSNLLVAPDGSRGVAVFGNKTESRIFSFALDGAGVPRQLGGPGVPIVWSWDSQWVLVQEGLPPEDEGGEGAMIDGAGIDRFVLGAPKGKKKARKKKSDGDDKQATTRSCAMRAIGGEAKCWNHFDGVAFSPDSRHVLLRKDGNLYIGRVAGVQADKPKLLIEHADPGAVWLPVAP
jgi:hypothetical protein